MIAIREQIVRAFAALLAFDDMNGDPVTVARGRDTPVTDYPALVLEEGAELASEDNYGQQDLTMTLTVYGYVSETADEGDVDGAGANYEAAKTDLYARAVQAALTERTLGGLAEDIRLVSMTPDIAYEAATNAGNFTVVFEVDYWTATGNPFSQTTGG